MTDLLKNTFFDINKFPKGYGLLVFPISISRITNGQSASDCIAAIKHFSPSKITEPKVGLQMLYSDTLYLHSKESATELKHSNMVLTINHRNAFLRLLQKNRFDFQIREAFAFQPWAELYLSYEGDFASDLKRIHVLYAKDKKFQKYVAEDAKYNKRKLTKEQIDFYLEEHLMCYLMSKGKIPFRNNYVNGREKWILWCYPGPQLKGVIYLYQIDPFKLSSRTDNVYQNCVYDLESKKLIDFTRIDLETYNYSYDN